MSSVYPHKTGGNKIRYQIYFPDGTNKVKNKYSKLKSKAAELQKDTSILEHNSLNKTLTAKDLAYFKNKKIITEEEARKLSGNKNTEPLTWNKARGKYEKFSNSSHVNKNYRSQLSRLNKLEEHFGEIFIEDITPDDILLWQEKRLKEVSSSSVNKERYILSQIFDMAIDDKAITEHPFEHRALKKSLPIDKSRLPVSANYMEIKLLKEAVNKNKGLLDGQIELAFLIFLFGGLRRGETCFLETKKDFSGNSIIIQGKDVSTSESTDPDIKATGKWMPKNKKPRSVDIHPTIMKKIRGLLKGQQGRFVFGGDKVWTKDHFTKTFARLLRPINPKLTLHCLRHTFVTWRIEHGINGKGDNLARVQMIAGHSKIDTTMRYTHIHLKPEKNILKLFI